MNILKSQYNLKPSISFPSPPIVSICHACHSTKAIQLAGIEQNQLFLSQLYSPKPFAVCHPFNGFLLDMPPEPNNSCWKLPPCSCHKMNWPDLSGRQLAYVIGCLFDIKYYFYFVLNCNFFYKYLISKYSAEYPSITSTNRSGKNPIFASISEELSDPD